MIDWSNSIKFSGAQGLSRGHVTKGPNIGAMVELRERDEIWGVFRNIPKTGGFEFVESFSRNGVSLIEAKSRVEKIFSAKQS